MNKLQILFLVLLFKNTFCLSQAPGTLDTSFDFDGKVITNSNSGGARIWDLLVQPDGKIVGGGASGSIGNSDVIIARYNSDGSIDNTFGVNGLFINDYGTGNDYVISIDLQPDGKIIGFGEMFNGQNRDVLVIRINQGGTIDSTFGINGKVILNPLGVNEFGYDMQLLNTGKIIGLFQINYGGMSDCGLMRLNNNGTLDSLFNNNGIGVYDIDGNGDALKAIAIQTDNKIVAVGNGTGVCALVRFFEDGDLDSTFNQTGKVIINYGLGLSSYSDIAIQSDNKIIVGGLVYPSSQDFLFARFNSDGSIDSSYNISGYNVVTSGTALNDLLYSINLQPDNKIIAAGMSGTMTFGTYNYFLTRLDTNGILDNSFGSGGKVLTDFNGSDDLAFALAIQPDLKIVAAGETWQNGIWNISLARYFSGLNVGIIDNLNEVNKLMAYPNPVIDYVNLNFELNNATEISISLFDLTGKEVKRILRNEMRVKGMNNEAIYLGEEIKRGIYLLKIFNDGFYKCVKLVKE